MNLALVKKLIRILEKSSVDEIEVEQDGLRVRLAKNSPVAVTHAPIGYGAALPAASVHHGTPGTGVTGAPHDPAAAPAEKKYHEIRSPIVGTFYRASAPDAEPYVEVGQAVQEKTVLCIVEAMKLMNEIESDVGGRIIKILVENGRPVEYNQVLFHLEPA